MHLMINPYFVQLIGILLTSTGVVALTVSAQIFGRPLTSDEQLRMGNKHSGAYRLLINLETVASAAVFLAGVGILKWSNFSLCSFLAYWLPELPETIRLLLSCH